MWNPNKMRLDNVGLRAVNILPLIRLGFPQQVAAPSECPENNFHSQLNAGVEE